MNFQQFPSAARHYATIMENGVLVPKIFFPDHTLVSTVVTFSPLQLYSRDCAHVYVYCLFWWFYDLKWKSSI